MATHRIGILGANTLPDTSGNVFFEPYPTKATNDFWKHGVFVFNDTSTKDSLYGTFTVPQNYASNAKFVVYWTSTGTSGNVVWNVDYRDLAGNDTNSLDQSTAQEALAFTAAAAPGATDRLMQTSKTATSGNFAAGDLVEFKVSRDGTSGSDTLAAAVTVHAVVFEYTDV